MAKVRTASVNEVESFARTAPSLEGVSLEMALAYLYDEEAGMTEASRTTLASLTHYSEKRVRTLTNRLSKSGRWTVQARGNAAKAFVPAI